MVLPTEESQGYQVGSDRELKVRRASTIIIKKLLNEMTDRQKSSARYHDDHHKIYLDTQHLMNLRLHRKCDMFEDSLKQALEARNYAWLNGLRQQMSEKVVDFDPAVLPEIVHRLNGLEEEYRVKEAYARSMHGPSTESGASELSSFTKRGDAEDGESSVYDQRVIIRDVMAER